MMDLRLDHVRYRIRRKTPLLPTPHIQQLKQQTTTSQRRPPLLPTPPSTLRSHAQQPTTVRRSTLQQSLHPDFTNMVTELNVTTRLLYGYDNWSTSFPHRLSASLDNFVSSIQPPRRSEHCTAQLQQATNDYKDTISQIIKAHLASNTLVHLRRLRHIKADLRDWQLAVDTAKRQLQRSHRHLLPSATQHTFSNLLNFILHPSTSTSDLLAQHFPNITDAAAATTTPAAVSGSLEADETQFIVLSSTQDTTTTAAADEPAPDVDAHQEPSDTGAAADQSSLEDIILHSPNMVPTPHTTPTPPTFIIPRSSPLSVSDLRRQLPVTPATTALTSAIHTPTPPLPQRLRPRPHRSTNPATATTYHTAQPHPVTANQSITSPRPPTTISTNNTITPIPTSSSPSFQPATNTSNAVSENIRSFRHEQHNEWKIGPEPQHYDTLVIADSNGKRWTDAPPNWAIYSFGGMKLSDVSTIMAAAPNLSQFRYIVIHCGRNDSYLSVKANINNFVTFLHSLRLPRLLIVPSLMDPQLHEPALLLFQQIIVEEFGDASIVYDEPHLYYRLHKHDTKHYSCITARHLIQVIMHRLN
ncbi:hypothetical protein HC928_12815 [bacterium]|nr:hypothetical protein [bacterium]